MVKLESQDQITNFLPYLPYGIGFLALFFISKGIEIFAVPYYQMTLGINPFHLSLAITLPLILASFVGPWVGKLSDDTNSRFGRRKPYIFIFSIISAGLYGLLWMVEPSWTHSQQLLYFVCCTLGFYLAANFVSIPLTCFTYEASSSSYKRTQIIGFASYFTYTASIFYQWLFPLSQSEFFATNHQGIMFVGWTVALVFIWFASIVPIILKSESNNTVSGYKNKQAVNRNLKQNLAKVFANHKMKILLIVLGLQMLVGGYAAAMDYYLIVYRLLAGDIAAGSVWKGVLSTSYAIMGIVYIPIVTRLVRQVGQISTLKIIFLLTALGGILKWFIFVPDSRWLLLADAVFCSPVWTAMAIVMPAILADISDENSQTEARDSKGVFVSVYNWAIGIFIALAMVIAALSLNWLGFDAEMGVYQAEASLLGMKYILVFGTIISALFAYLILGYYHKVSNTDSKGNVGS
ncbi:MFS transporter [Catenovulum maritimum]|uniref:MFS transporter n=1 Tax=Catenovulum maritimum TaxID=1513271 RepID=A0A0J8GVC1_9ALTE|nr:MFS transporter [Catenovulum maritimum]KMT66687.1 hypothetical protein XM47_00715 [Catenovulum maritimum]